MKTVLMLLIAAAIILLIVFLLPEKTQAPMPVRQTSEIRQTSNSNDQEAVNAIEENLP